jgi:hypothetical protein
MGRIHLALFTFAIRQNMSTSSPSSSVSASTAMVPATKPTSTSNGIITTTSPLMASVSRGLSTGARAGIGGGAAVGAIASMGLLHC